MSCKIAGHLGSPRNDDCLTCTHMGVNGGFPSKWRMRKGGADSTVRSTASLRLDKTRSNVEEEELAPCWTLGVLKGGHGVGPFGWEAGGHYEFSTTRAHRDVLRISTELVGAQMVLRIQHFQAMTASYEH